MRVLPLVAQAALLLAFVLSAVAANVSWTDTPLGPGSLWQAPEGGSWYADEVESVGGTGLVKASVFVVLGGIVLTLAAAMLGFLRGPVPLGVTAVVGTLALLTGAVLHRAAVERHLEGLDAAPAAGMVLAWVAAGLGLVAGVLAMQSAVMARSRAPEAATAETA